MSQPIVGDEVQSAIELSDAFANGSGVDFFQQAVAVAEGVRLDAYQLEHRQEQVVQRGFILEANVSAISDRSRSAAGNDDRQLVVTMAIAVSQTAAKHDHRMVQQTAVAVFRLAEPLQEVSKLRYVEVVDLLQVGNFFLIVTMVLQGMVTTVDADPGVAAVAALGRQHHRRDARAVRSEGQKHQVVHQP